MRARRSDVQPTSYIVVRRDFFGLLWTLACLSTLALVLSSVLWEAYGNKREHYGWRDQIHFQLGKEAGGGSSNFLYDKDRSRHAKELGLPVSASTKEMYGPGPMKYVKVLVRRERGVTEEDYRLNRGELKGLRSTRLRSNP